MLETVPPQEAPAVDIGDYLAPSQPPPPETTPLVSRSATEEILDAWTSVRAGATLNLVACLGYALALGLLLIASLTTLEAARTQIPTQPMGPTPTFPRTALLVLFLGGLGGLLLVGNWLLAALGNTFSLLAPPRYNARGLAGATLLMSVLFLLQTTSTVRSFNPGSGPDSPVVLLERLALGSGMLLAALFELCRLTLLPLFLRAVAQNLRDRRLAAHALILAIGMPTALVLAILGNIAVSYVLSLLGPPANRPPTFPQPPTPFPWSGAILFLLNTGLAMLLLGWTAVLLALTRRAITSRLQSRPTDR